MDHKPHEREIAELLIRELGEKVYLVPRVNDPQGVRTPDYLIQNKPYDLKTIHEGAGENTIFNRIKKSRNQSDNFVIDVSKSGLSDKTIDEQLEKVFWSQNTQFVKEIIVLKDEKVYRIKRRKK